MKNVALTLLLICFAPTMAFANAQEHGLKIGPEECPAVWEDLVKFHLWENPDALFDFDLSPVYRDEVATLKFVSFKDLDPGSWDVRRQVVFTMKLKSDYPEVDATLTVITQGNLFCEDEELKSFEDLVFTYDI